MGILGERIAIAIASKKKEGLTKTEVGKLLYPQIDNKGAYIRMSKMIKDANYIKPEHVHIICEATGVDPNFLFGKPSKHDKLLIKK